MIKPGIYGAEAVRIVVGNDGTAHVHLEAEHYTFCIPVATIEVDERWLRDQAHNNAHRYLCNAYPHSTTDIAEFMLETALSDGKAVWLNEYTNDQGQLLIIDLRQAFLAWVRDLEL